MRINPHPYFLIYLEDKMSKYNKEIVNKDNIVTMSIIFINIIALYFLCNKSR